MRVVVRVVVGTAAWGSAGRAAGTHRHTAHVSRDPRDTASDSASSLMLTPLASYYPERDSFFVNLFSSLRQNTQSPSAWALHILRGVPPPVPRAAAVLRSAERTRSPQLSNPLCALTHAPTGRDTVSRDTAHSSQSHARHMQIGKRTDSRRRRRARWREDTKVQRDGGKETSRFHEPRSTPCTYGSLGFARRCGRPQRM